MVEDSDRAPAAPERDCENCFYVDQVTGACTKDDCVDGDKFVQALEPEDMYKALYMILFNIPFTVQKHLMAGTVPKESFASIPEEAFEKFDAEKMKVLIGYDHERKRYTFETSQQPKADLIIVPRRRNRKLIVRGRN